MPRANLPDRQLSKPTRFVHDRLHATACRQATECRGQPACSFDQLELARNTESEADVVLGHRLGLCEQRRGRPAHRARPPARTAKTAVRRNSCPGLPERSSRRTGPPAGASSSRRYPATPHGRRGPQENLALFAVQVRQLRRHGGHSSRPPAFSRSAAGSGSPSRSRGLPLMLRSDR